MLLYMLYVIIPGIIGDYVIDFLKKNCKITLSAPETDLRVEKLENGDYDEL